MSDKELPLKGYWIGTVDVTDPNAYKDYVAANAVAFEKYGAKFLVRGGRTETLEGRFRTRTVVLEFKDYETALACYRSPEYTAAKALRDKVSSGDLIVAEGYAG
ncbi:MAG TPA: DUF1330 domain-containing protein [Beijerinckiaceae bacterium]|jgi:uncharacterized protein (DUF1330 family)|nr:DUF1330 domain-containing protein [Beijerinckiaceae bacterium]